MTGTNNETRKGNDMNTFETIRAGLGTDARDILDRAIAGGITESQLEMLFEAYPTMRKDLWWTSNAISEPVRAVRYRLDKIDSDAWKAQAKKWTDAELREVVKKHRANQPVDSDKLAEATSRGLISMSAAMNSDF